VLIDFRLREEGDLSVAAELAAAYIASVQLGDGAIPWFPGGKLDPWDHVEAAIGLDIAGYHRQARHAYEWLFGVQNSDGSWPSRFDDGLVTDATRDTNLSTYIAVGVWTHYLITHDRAWLRRAWPAIEAAIEFALSLQGPEGEVYWAMDGRGNVWNEALKTGSSSVYLSLRCAIAAAAELGLRQARWRAGLERLRLALAFKPRLFAQLGKETQRYAMDWYYPVLSGALGRDASRFRLKGRWTEFVREGWGALCVCDEPWVTVAETCELAIALTVAGEATMAERLLCWSARFQDADGGFWTGARYPDGAIWPPEKPTWTAGAFVIANALLEGDQALRRVFLT
jgi:hypothetical protein